MLSVSQASRNLLSRPLLWEGVKCLQDRRNVLEKVQSFRIDIYPIQFSISQASRNLLSRPLLWVGVKCLQDRRNVLEKVQSFRIDIYPVQLLFRIQLTV